MGQLDSHFPVRSCIGCRKKANPAALIRVVLIEGRLVPDIKGGAPGRGAWLHKECAAGAISRGAFRFALKINNKEQDVAIDVSELLKFLES